MSDTRAQRRRPTIANEWQLAVLKKIQSVSGNPTEDQLLAAAAETGLDEKWVRNWFTRQRSKLAARGRKGQPATTNPAIVPTFRLQLPRSPSASSDLASRRPVSTPVDPAPNFPALPRRRSPAASESRSPRSTVNVETTSRPHRSTSAPVYSDNLPMHTTTTPAYSRDPLCNRYPDFSQFFRPRGHERSYFLGLSTLIDGHGRPMHPNALVHLEGLSNLRNPFQLGGLATNPCSSTYLQPCPVAFSMRLVDILGRP